MSDSKKIKDLAYSLRRSFDIMYQELSPQERELAIEIRLMEAYNLGRRHFKEKEVPVLDLQHLKDILPLRRPLKPLAVN